MLEPFYGGSHQRFCEALERAVPGQWTRLTLKAKHWKWHARSCVTYWTQTQPEILKQRYDAVFTSSLVPICELIALNRSLATVPIIVYCHENQFSYPSRRPRERDNHFGFSEFINFQVATQVVFNSEFNRSSFLENAGKFLKRMPDCSLLGQLDKIANKSEVVPVLFDYPCLEPEPTQIINPRGPLILWNHRWEHDKNPEAFFDALHHLHAQGVPFRLSLCGQRFSRIPECFTHAITALAPHMVNDAPFHRRSEYTEMLGQADIVVSTANHEFFGISMLEAALCGAYPLVPNRLVYPEIYPSEFWFDADEDLSRRLSALIDDYMAGKSLRADRRHLFRHLVHGVDEQFRLLFAGISEASQL
jgi:glycosyltransferase involved in cell wall biosynthesis